MSCSSCEEVSDDDRQQPGALVGPQPPQHLQPVDLRQLEVEQHQRRQVPGRGRRGAGAEQVLQRLDAVADDHDLG